jgi:hypothetical protein
MYRETKQVSTHITAGWYALNKVREYCPTPKRVNEMFGGVGAQARIAHHLWPFAEHHVADNSPAAAAYLKSTLPPEIQVHQLNAYLWFRPAEIQVADFGDLTIHRMGLKPWNSLLDDIFESLPQFVVLTDIAGPKLHLFHRRWGQFDRYPGYLEILGDYVNHRWGYFPIATFWHYWSAITVYSAVPVEENHSIVNISGLGPVGLKLEKTS